jgi:hypothetical protein
MSEIITAGIAYETPKGCVIKTTRPAVEHLSDEVRVFWSDNRCISAEQRRKAWALMTEIAAYQGQDKEDVYREQSAAFSIKNFESLQGHLFHLSTATVSEAREFINLLIEIIIEYGIPTKEPLYGLCDDLERYTYACLMNKKCAVCGRKTELHHVDHVGMGYNRKEINHIGMRCLPLCREHHMEAHNIGQTAFDAKYHLEPIAIDEKIAQKYRLRGTEA